jgi:hypothetical protein
MIGMLRGLYVRAGGEGRGKRIADYGKGCGDQMSR